MNNARKNRIRTILLLELNSSFNKAFDETERNGGDPEDIEFLTTLIDSIRTCVEGETKLTTETTFNS